MLDGLLIAPRTKKQILYNIFNINGGIILSGDKGLGKSLVAKRMAAHMLGCEVSKLHLQPDYMLIEPIDGTVRVKQIQEIKEKACMAAANSKRKVFIIDDADSMSQSSQNSMLKLIEEKNSTNIVLFVAHKPLLQTIHSRCSEINFLSPSIQELSSFLKERCEGIDEIVLDMSGGKVGLYYEMMLAEDFLRDTKHILDTFNTMSNRRELINAFHALKEKDPHYFYEKYDTRFVSAFLGTIRDIFKYLVYAYYLDLTVSPVIDYQKVMQHYTVNEAMSIAEEAEYHMVRMYGNGTYNKNDFFSFIMSIA